MSRWWVLARLPHPLNQHHTHESWVGKRGFLLPSILYISGRNERRNWPAMLRKTMMRSQDHLLLPDEEAVELFFEIGGISLRGDWLRSVSRLSTFWADTITRINHWAERFCFWVKQKSSSVLLRPPRSIIVKWLVGTSYLSENAYPSIKRAFFPSFFWYHHFHLSHLSSKLFIN